MTLYNKLFRLLLINLTLSLNIKFLLVKNVKIITLFSPNSYLKSPLLSKYLKKLLSSITNAVDFKIIPLTMLSSSVLDSSSVICLKIPILALVMILLSLIIVL